MGMNVNAVNLYGGAGAAGPSNYVSTAKYVPSDEERQEKLSRIDEKANGGTSRDGDTVTVSAEGSKLQKLYENNGKSAVDFLKEDTGIRGSVPETISANSEKMGISKEQNENRIRSAEIDALKNSVENVSTENKADTEDRIAERTEKTNGEAEQNRVKAEEKSVITEAQNKADDKNPAAAVQNREENNTEAVKAQNKPTEEPKEDINTGNQNVKAQKEFLQEVREKNQQEAKRQENKRLDAAETKEAQEHRAENTEKRLETERENIERARKADEELYNVAFSFKDSPYDATSSIKEMEEDTQEVGVNRIEAPERNNTPERTATVAAKAPETTEENNRLEDISSTVNSENVQAADNAQNIAEAANASAQTTIDENAVNSRFTVQEVA